MGLHIGAEWDSGTQTYSADPVVSGRANHVFGSIPHIRVLRDASAMTNVYAVSMATDPATAAKLGYEGNYQEVPTWIRLLDALSGIQVVQYDPALQDALRVYRLREAAKQNLETRHATQDYGSDYIERSPR